MESQGRNFRMLISCWTALWITLFLISCNAFPNPQSNMADEDDYFANFAATKGAPLITPLRPHVTFEAKSNHTLRCEANEPVVWRGMGAYDSDSAPYNTLISETPYGSVLHLRDVTVLNVGYYYCVKSKAVTEDMDLDALVEDFNAAKIYVFVNDPEFLLVPMEVPVINAIQYDDIVIPCKPTVPDRVVKLITPNQEVISNSLTPQQLQDFPPGIGVDAINYNPMIGFVMRRAANLTVTYLDCCGEHGDAKETFSMYIVLDCLDLIIPESPMLSYLVTLQSEVDQGLTQQTSPPSSVSNQLLPVPHTKLVEVYSSETAGRYDPLLGFVVQIQQISETGFYTCRPEKPSPLNEHEENNFLVHFSGNELYDTRTTHVNKPQIYSPSHGHAVEGESFNLTCTVEIRHSVRFVISWETPLDKDPKSKARQIASSTQIERVTDSHTVGKSVLTVSNTQKSDGGNYKCYVRDHSDNSAHNTYLMTILKNGESYINISEPNNYYTIKTNASKLVQINAKYRGYPTPSLNWYSPDGKLIQPTRKYEINRTNASITLKVNDLELSDTGVYILRANNGVDEKELKFNVYVKDKPQVSVEDVYVQAGEQARLICRTVAYPAALIVWSFTPCNITPKWPTCEGKQIGFNSTRNTAQGDSEIERIHELIFKPEKPGVARCTATNVMGINVGRGMVLMGDLTDNMTVYGVDENSKIAKGDEVIMTCAALVYYYSADLDWFKDGQIIENSNSVEVKTTFSDYSYKKAIKFKNIQDDHAGSYECRARIVDSDSEYDSKFLSIVVHDPAAPAMSQTNLGGQIKRALGESLELICKSTGIPKAGVTWYKDDVKVNSENNVLIEEDNSVLRIPFLKPEDEGLYKCVAANRLGVAEASSQVKITNMPGLKLSWILGIVALIVVLISFIITLCVRILKDRKTFRQMKLAGLANFEEGAIEQINPAMSLDEQADLLPYDRRFEFPKDKLKLGKKLGAGAFGVVLKAYAEGINPDEKETVVAVKMVKRSADNEVIKALVSELKIMVHLGQHLNVVNLLGAVTKDIAKREVMVIVEYCRYGNVQNFLLSNRKRFIDQINPITDKIDPSITEPRFSAGDFEINRNSENDPRSGTRAGRPNSSGYLRQSDLYEGNMDSCATEQTVMTTIPEGEDNVMSNNSVQPAWRSNYKPDTNEAMTVTTSDLVSWAFQVARGMDYLSSRKVLHGDLAARNILLCEDNVVKICDFGLARSMYKNDNYKKQGEAPLPIKWLALESLSDQVFSTYTDVWSFGIVLWEFFSLAKVPYPGMVANQSLYLKLKDGYRMEKPPYANEELYDIMLECWSANPESRPLFHELEKKFAKLLGDEVTNHYVDLNEPYLRMNTEYMKQKETDYLALMGNGPPDEMAPPPPRYVNGMILPEIRIDSSDDYLQMSPKAEQHSPTISNNLDSPVMKNRKKIGVPPEEIPMLEKSQNGNHRAGSQSDSDTEQSPSPQTVGRTFAQISRAPAEIETSLSGSDGNYVNVKPADLSKKFINSNGTKDAFSNPSYLMLKTVNEGRK